MLEEKILEIIGDRADQVSVIVKDLKSDKWILKINENKIFQSASVIKIPIMVEALRQIEEGKYSLDKKITIDNKDKVDFSIITELDVEEYSILDLITLMIITSDNTATNVLIDIVGYDNINNLMANLGLKDSKLSRKMMDFQGIKEGRKNLTTTADMANILEALYNTTFLNSQHSKLALNIMKRQTHRDLIPRHLDEDIVIAHKTGSLDGLNHDIGIVFSKKTDYIIGVFTEKGKTNLINKELIGEISKLVYNFLTIQSI